MNTILVPTSGTDTDSSVFVTALALARALGGHLQCYHVRLSQSERAVRTPHVQYCIGRAIKDGMDSLLRQDQSLSDAANGHFAEFCNANDLRVQEAPSTDEGVSAALLEETDQTEARLLMHARHSDWLVLGRPHTDDLMPDQLIELLLLGCGRPIVIAPASATKSVTGTIVVGWKETSNAARALSAAMPLLTRADRVVLATINEGDALAPEALDPLVRQLAWHGIAAEPHRIESQSKPADILAKIAADVHADLLVVGGFGHAPLREAVFGGVTRALIEHAECPVLMHH